MSCATCDVHVEPRWMEALGEPSEDKVALLEMAIDPDATSRLSCQIRLDETLDGLTVRLPRAQF